MPCMSRLHPAICSLWTYQSSSVSASTAVFASGAAAYTPRDEQINHSPRVNTVSSGTRIRNGRPRSRATSGTARFRAAKPFSTDHSSSDNSAVSPWIIVDVAVGSFKLGAMRQVLYLTEP
ncbi:hypothetical protein F4779DRAFT_614939 [Xylariaceae sp. FL0662B]|nr:hypothetical protein F4779DRAFT_614939 [Xylariaceae sp. FL0662B]